MSLPCSKESCEQISTIYCYTCKQNLCLEHFKEHDQNLNSQLNPLAHEIKNLSTRYSVLDINQLLIESRQKLDQWRADSHQTIDRIYQEKCEELKENWSVKLTRPQKDLDRIRAKINEFNRKQKTTHEDIKQLIQALQYIHQQIKDIEQNGILININQKFEKENQIEKTQLLNLSSIYRTINCSNQSGVLFNNNQLNLLIYEKYKLKLFNQDLIFIEDIPWENNLIYDMCWAKTLNQFIIITEKNFIYLINEKPLAFIQIKSIEQNKWWSCTTSDKVLFLSTYGNDPNIYLFDLLSEFKFIKRWRSPQTCQQNEFIHNINYSNETILLIIGNSNNQIAKIELCSSITLTKYWIVDINIQSIPYQSIIRSTLFKSNQWIIIIENTKNIFHLSSDGNIRNIYQYQYPIWNVLSLHSNLLALRTDQHIYFHKI